MGERVSDGRGQGVRLGERKRRTGTVPLTGQVRPLALAAIRLERVGRSSAREPYFRSNFYPWGLDHKPAVCVRARQRGAEGPTRRICAPPGLGLPPLPGTPGFAGRGPSYELLVFQFATGEFIGVQHLRRPDIYLSGTPPCPQQPGGAYIYIPRNHTWSCFRAI